MCSTRINVFFKKDSSNKVLVIEKMRGNLYIMNSITERYYCNFFNPRDISMQEWHIALGHPSVSTMKHMRILSRKMLKAMEVIERCDVCIKARQTRSQFLS